MAASCCQMCCSPSVPGDDSSLLACLYACSPSSQGGGLQPCAGVMGGLGLQWGWEPDCASDAVAQCDLYPSFHGAPCRSLQGQQVLARRTLSPSQQPLLRSGGNISCQDLSSPGCSLESAMAAQLTPRFFGPPVASQWVLPTASWAARHACPKNSSPGGAGVGKEGEWLQWQWVELAAPSWGGEKYPGWIIGSPEHRKSVHASDISPNLSCFATCPPKKRI